MEASLHEMMHIGSGDEPQKVRKYLEDLGININWLKLNEAYRFISNDTDVLIHPGDNGDFTRPAKEFASLDKDNYEETYKKLLDYFDLCKKVNDSIEALERDNLSKLDLLKNHIHLVRVAGYSAQEVIDKFKFPKNVEDALGAYWMYLGSPLYDLPFVVWSVVITNYIGYGAYIPLNTSYEMSLKMAIKAKELGIDIEYGIEVEKILVENNIVKGIKTSKGNIIKAKYVVSSAYPDTVFSNMIEPKTEIPKKASKFVNSKDVGLTCFSVVMSLDKDYKELNIKDYATFYSLGDFDMHKMWDNLKAKDNYNYLTSVCINVANPNASPKGTCVYSITVLPRIESWDDVTKDNYEDKKNKLAKELISAESKRLGVNLFDHIIDIVIETPVTISHYTNAYNGSIYGYRHSMMDHAVARNSMYKNEKYIKGLYFVGAHQKNGDGMAPVINGARLVAKEILTDNNK